MRSCLSACLVTSPGWCIRVSPWIVVLHPSCTNDTGYLVLPLYLPYLFHVARSTNLQPYNPLMDVKSWKYLLDWMDVRYLSCLEL